MNQNDVKKEFMETLSKIMKHATEAGSTISEEEIHSYFKDILTDETMYDVICRYLTEAGITVSGYQQPVPSIHKEITESNQALAFYEMYLDEVHAIPAPSSDTIPKLLHSLTSGSPDAAGELSKLYLPLVIKLCEDFEHMGLTHSDLVAEGNLALYEAILDYATPSDTSKAVGSTQKDKHTETNCASLSEQSQEQAYFEEYLCRQIKNTLQTATQAELGHHHVSNHLADQINALNNASTELAQDLGREATLEELCEKLSLSEDEIKQLMKITIDALSVIQTDED